MALYLNFKENYDAEHIKDVLLSGGYTLYSHGQLTIGTQPRFSSPGGGIELILASANKIQIQGEVAEAILKNRDKEAKKKLDALLRYLPQVRSITDDRGRVLDDLSGN